MVHPSIDTPFPVHTPERCPYHRAVSRSGQVMVSAVLAEFGERRDSQDWHSYPALFVFEPMAATAVARESVKDQEMAAALHRRHPGRIASHIPLAGPAPAPVGENVILRFPQYFALKS